VTEAKTLQYRLSVVSNGVSQFEVEFGQGSGLVEHDHVDAACFDQFLGRAGVGFIRALLQGLHTVDHVAEDSHRQRDGHESGGEVPAEPTHHPEGLELGQPVEAEELGNAADHHVPNQLLTHVVAQEV